MISDINIVGIVGLNGAHQAGSLSWRNCQADCRRHATSDAET